MGPKLYSYIVARDFGFAPNPFYEFCTLATCKPQIRRKAAIGDWIVGTGTKAKERSGYLVFSMRVTETLPFEEYWADIRFHCKRPAMHASLKAAFGDNIYYRDMDTGEWCQLDSHHSHEDGTQNMRNIENDTQVNRVLISDDFIYWGGSGPFVPTFHGQTVYHSTQGHRSKFPDQVVTAFIDWLRGLNDSGYCGAPLEWE